MTLTQQDLHKIKQALQPEFDKVKSDIKQELQPEFNKLNKKIESLKKQNRKDHNMIIDFFDRDNIQLEKRVTKIEQHLNISPLSRSL